MKGAERYITCGTNGSSVHDSTEEVRGYNCSNREDTVTKKRIQRIVLVDEDISVQETRGNSTG